MPLLTMNSSRFRIALGLTRLRRTRLPRWTTMTTETNQPTPQPSVQERVRAFIVEAGTEGWDHAWKEKVTPWDAGVVQPPLRDILSSGQLPLPSSGRAFVPGCGKGYDAIHIASTTGFETLAVDISPTAVDAANQLLASSQVSESVKVSFKTGDFFALRASDIEPFDLIYDYTFFVAIPPSRRQDWGQVMSRIVKPGGYLITLIFPLDPPQDYGPPFFVRPEHYVEVLGDGWEKVVDKVPEASLPTHVDRERLVVWKKL